MAFRVGGVRTPILEGLAAYLPTAGPVTVTPFPDLTRFCRLDELGVPVVGQRLESDCAVLARRVGTLPALCRRCRCRGSCYREPDRARGRQLNAGLTTSFSFGSLVLLRGSALGLRNLTNSIARSLLETGGFRLPHCQTARGQ